MLYISLALVPGFFAFFFEKLIAVHTRGATSRATLLPALREEGAREEVAGPWGQARSEQEWRGAHPDGPQMVLRWCRASRGCSSAPGRSPPTPLPPPEWRELAAEAGRAGRQCWREMEREMEREMLGRRRPQGRCCLSCPCPCLACLHRRAQRRGRAFPPSSPAYPPHPPQTKRPVRSETRRQCRWAGQVGE